MGKPILYWFALFYFILTKIAKEYFGHKMN
nr:MAG TPA: hypothetical protein [Caudoviricetes sp.]